jgi:hypothetical protein
MSNRTTVGVAAVLDGAHHFQLGEAHMAGVGRHATQRRRAGRDMLAGSYAGGSFLFARSGVRRSNGLVIARIVLVGHLRVERGGLELGMPEQS